jgi:hypothetical protein
VRHRHLRLTIALAFLVGLAGAAYLSGLSGRPVPLLTGWGALGPREAGEVRCYTNFAVGQLVVDAEFGTALIEDGREAVPVMWPPGHTARESGSEVEVLDRSGKVVAKTGNRYQIEGAGSARYPEPGWLACGYVLPWSSQPRTGVQLTTYLTTYESIAGGTQRYEAVPAVRGSGADTRI